MFASSIEKTFNSVNAADLGAKQAVHSVGQALCILGALRIVCVQQPKWRPYQQAQFFMPVAFVAITFISDAKCIEWFHKSE